MVLEQESVSRLTLPVRRKLNIGYLTGDGDHLMVVLIRMGKEFGDVQDSRRTQRGGLEQGNKNERPNRSENEQAKSSVYCPSHPAVALYAPYYTGTSRQISKGEYAACPGLVSSEAAVAQPALAPIFSHKTFQDVLPHFSQFDGCLIRRSFKLLDSELGFRCGSREQFLVERFRRGIDIRKDGS